MVSVVGGPLVWGLISATMPVEVWPCETVYRWYMWVPVYIWEHMREVWRLDYLLMMMRLQLGYLCL